jgi:copper type II ascorbate-dependent monooxygenase-like protein
MKLFALAVLALAVHASCASDSPPAADEAVYTISVPEFTLQPGEEKFYCYYTTLPVTADTGVKAYTSDMTPGSHHMILFFLPAATQPDGTLAECASFGGGGGGLATIPIFAYASQAPHAEQQMPDGVGVALAAQQPVLVNMHYFNITDQPIVAKVAIDVHTYKPETTYTPAHAYVTFNTQIAIPPQKAAAAEGTCDVPANANFILMSTHSHRYTTSARVLDGSNLVLETKDYEHAAVASWTSAPFQQFASGKLTYHCDYYNPTSTTITVGESALTSEMCMAAGYFFPATSDQYCLNSTVLSL